MREGSDVEEERVACASFPLEQEERERRQIHSTKVPHETFASDVELLDQSKTD